MSYKPENHIRIVTAASLFDGHDASINIMRRILQATGAEVIHLGHDRSVGEIVDCAIQEDVQAIAVTSYQGGHMEFFKYMHDLLHEAGCGHIRIFGGGGGVILPDEIAELQSYGIERIYSPDDGRHLGLQGMIDDVLTRSDFPAGKDVKPDLDRLKRGEINELARFISAAENFPLEVKESLQYCLDHCESITTPVLGITGTGGAGKSSLIDELIRRFLDFYPSKKIAILSVDPSRRKSGGALLGDRIRMNSVYDSRVYMRSLATRQANVSLSKHIREALCIVKNAGFDLIILESSGIGQSDTGIVDFCNHSLYVMTPEYGAPSQLEKIDMLDFADFVALNKSDKRGAEDALRDVRKQMQRNRTAFDKDTTDMPVFPTIASQFNDNGVNMLFKAVMNRVSESFPDIFDSVEFLKMDTGKQLQIIPPQRVRYLSEISETVRKYNADALKNALLAQQLQSVMETAELILKKTGSDDITIKSLKEELEHKLGQEYLGLLKNWPDRVQSYRDKVFVYHVRNKAIEVDTHTESLAHLQIPKVAVPTYNGWADILKWNLLENFPGEFPFAAGVFPFKREEEDPTRMFAGEGGPERTNKRFHYLSEGMPAIRLSTAFDSVTLYGRDPHQRPDIYGKVGNSGVSICTLDDIKKLYSGFDLADPKTSVSMTINGPAPAMTAFFMNAAIDQQCEKYIIQNGLEADVQYKIQKIYKDHGQKVPHYQGELPNGNNGLGLMLLGVTGDQVLPADVYQKIKADTLCRVRGTVQADILKEDQAQNTCIFSTDFSLKMMGDMQEYFNNQQINNFYSVSISGYHIAEAGANPISQLAFTLANGFTFVEYYLSRGMNIDDFAPNFSFFFSNGIDPEFSVMGRVARLIWSKAMKIRYSANERSQKLKYHIQTSGRSLHAQEIDFNDIRTTLQALYAIYDNCNSLHTNAYDEAITTPTEESVRRAIAIQLIINRELGLAKNQNPLQGSFIIEELTRLVEEAVLSEFDRITSRGGVLGAMETNYQRGKIQEESLYYETLKHTGEYPIIGVNTFLSSAGSPTVLPGEVIRATNEEKENQIANLQRYQKAWETEATVELKRLNDVALMSGNTFECLMEVCKFASLGSITDALFHSGGKYRRNL
ncbi:MAG: methylmalonyl-CoA mutase family protein [Bacteroidales bacterium]|nr:methylmalonyl-CoA mutase family protein [Bacteroidales bacterium]